MVLMLVILTITIFLFIDVLKIRKRNTVTIPSTPKLHFPSHEIVIERYFHPGHSWVSIDNQNTCTIGVDNFSQSIIGQIDVVDLPIEGTHINQGDPFARLQHHRKSISHVAPISGKIEKVNSSLWDHPTHINDSPYEKGWLVKIRPSNLERELNNLLRGTTADRWKEAVRTQLLQFFSPQLGTVLQDGGEIIQNLSDQLDEEDWQRLLLEFFPKVQHHHSLV